VVDFDWEEFLDLAEELVRRRGDPAAERSAVSRAYSAVFHEASQYVSRRGGRLTFTGDDHIREWDWFLQTGLDPPARWIGNTGHALRRARRAADYDPSPRPNRSVDAQGAVRLARRLLTEVSRLA
jgi:hypothetical protein